jgi:hypothetical protein
MRGLQRRLDRLEQVIAPLTEAPPVTALAFATGGDDLMFIGGEWLPCPNPVAILRRHDGPLKVYAGFDPREI